MLPLSKVRVGTAVCFLLAAAVSASASETKGTVRSVNAQANQIVVKGLLSDTTYDLTNGARVCLDGKNAKIDELREGDRVTIDFQKNGERFAASDVRALRNASETTGTVRGVVSERNQLIVKGALKDATYQLDKGGVVWINGKEGHLADLRENDHVRITYEQRGERLIATEVALSGHGERR